LEPDHLIPKSELKILTAIAFFTLSLQVAVPGLAAQSFPPPRRPDSTGVGSITGELQQWHRVTA
jgi:hypothetical protein